MHGMSIDTGWENGADVASDFSEPVIISPAHYPIHEQALEGSQKINSPFCPGSGTELPRRYVRFRSYRFPLCPRWFSLLSGCDYMPGRKNHGGLWPIP